MLHVFIMCGGQQTRMQLDTPKQLVPVNGVPLVVRTIQQIHQLDGVSRVTLVAPQSPAWIETAQQCNVERVAPQHSLFLHEVQNRLDEIRHDGRAAILCGDTVFSDAFLSQLLHPSKITFACRFLPNIYTGRASSELYGFSWPTNVEQQFLLEQMVSFICLRLNKVEEHIRAATTDEATIASVLEKNLSTWRLLHELYERAEVISTPIDDYTDDLDSPEDLGSLPKIEAAIQATTRRKELVS